MAHYLDRTKCRPRAGQLFTAAGERYVLGGKLGDGAAGLVRNAERQSNGKRVAIKLLAPDSKYIDEDAFGDVLDRFRREGRRGAELDHPSLLKIHAFEENVEGDAFDAGSPKNPFIVMERSSGGTLEHFLRRMHPKVQGVYILDETRLKIAVQLAGAIAHLHRRGIIHRDVKPANVFLSSRRTHNPSVRAKLGDFGVVKWGDFQSSLATGTLTVTMHKGLGTMKYMSPEQALEPKDVTVKADMYSLGVTLFELFTVRVLPSFHHVYQVVAARTRQGSTFGRWSNLGLSISTESAPIAELILDMHRQGATRRPTIGTVLGNLEWTLERLTEDDD